MAQDHDNARDEARALYEQFLRRADHDPLSGLEELCQQYPAYAQRFRELHMALPTSHQTGESQSVPEAVSEPPDPTPGAGDKYPFLGQLGKGGMGIVYRVWDVALRRELALKRVRDDRQKPAVTERQKRTAQDLVLRFAREAELTARLDHPGVVPIHEMGLDTAGRMYFTMRLVQGTGLDALLEQHRKGDRLWTQGRILDVIVKICETLAYAHSKGIIHRDLKPENIMVGRFGETYVMDWGLAKTLRESAVDGPATQPPDEELTSTGAGAPESGQSEPEIADPETMFAGHGASTGSTVETLAGSVMGTVSFMAPEQAGGLIGEIDERSDVYSVGAMLYQLLTGRRPYCSDRAVNSVDLLPHVLAGPPPAVSRLNPRAQSELTSICEKAMARRREDRYQSMQAMAEDLRAYLENRVVKAHRTGVWVELKKWILRHQGLTAGLGLAVLTAIIGVGIVLGLQWQRNQELIRHAVEIQSALEKEQQARTEAESERRRTEAVALMRESERLAGPNPVLALLLARESQEREPSSAANSAWWGALQQLHESAAFSLHQREIKHLAVSPDRRFAATASADQTAILWDFESFRPLRLLAGHTDELLSVAFSSDGTRVATASRDRTVCVWDSSTGALVKRFTGHSQWVYNLLFVPDGSQVISCDTSGRILIWPLATEGTVRSLQAGRPVWRLEFACGAQRLVALREDGQLLSWDWQRDDPQLLAEDSPVAGASRRRLRVSADGARVLCLELSGPPVFGPFRAEAVVVWSGETLHPERRIELEEKVRINAAEFVDSSTVALACSDGTLQIWDLNSGNRIHRQSLGDEAIVELEVDGTADRLAATLASQSVVLCKRSGQPLATFRGTATMPGLVGFGTGGVLISCTADAAVHFWKPRSLSGVEPVDVLELSNPKVRFSPDGTRVLLFSNQLVRLVEFPSGRVLNSLSGSQPVIDFCFDPSGDWIAILDGEFVVRIYAASDGRLQAMAAHEGPAGSVRFLDSQQLIVGSFPVKGVDITLTVCDPATGMALRRHRIPDHDLPHLCENGRFAWCRSLDGRTFSLWTTGEGQLVATTPPRPEGGRDQTSIKCSADGLGLLINETGGVSLFHAVSKRLVEDLGGNRKQEYWTQFDPGNGMVFVSGQGGNCRAYDGRTGSLLTGFEPLDSQIVMLVSSPKGDRVAIGTQSGSVRLWDGAQGTVIRSLGGEADHVRHLTFSPDSQWLAAAAREGRQLRVWSAADGNEYSDVNLIGSPVVALAFSPDSGWLVTLHADCSARIWPLPAGAAADRLMPRRLSVDEIDRYDLRPADVRRKRQSETHWKSLLEWLHLASRSPFAPTRNGAGLQVVATGIRSAFDGFSPLNQSQERRALLLELESQLTEQQLESSLLDAAIAQQYLELDDSESARRLLAAALRRRDLPDARIFEEWARLELAAGRTPAELLDEWGPMDHPSGSDVRWLLEQVNAGVPIRINAGDADEFVAEDGAVWRQDCFFRGGRTFGETIGLHFVSTQEIRETDDQRLYQTERWYPQECSDAERSYRLPLPSGSYRVTVYFAEIHFRPPENRAFRVVVEGEPLDREFSSLHSGFATPDSQSCEVSVSDGELVIEFQRSESDPKVSALQIERLGS